MKGIFHLDRIRGTQVGEPTGKYFPQEEFLRDVIDSFSFALEDWNIEVR